MSLHDEIYCLSDGDKDCVEKPAHTLSFSSSFSPQPLISSLIKVSSSESLLLENLDFFLRKRKREGDLHLSMVLHNLSVIRQGGNANPDSNPLEELESLLLSFLQSSCLSLRNKRCELLHTRLEKLEEGLLAGPSAGKEEIKRYITSFKYTLAVLERILRYLSLVELDRSRLVCKERKSVSSAFQSSTVQHMFRRKRQRLMLEHGSEDLSLTLIEFLNKKVKKWKSERLNNSRVAVKKTVICRICGKETRIESLQDHSNLCKEIEELKKDTLGIEEKILGFSGKVDKLKKHLAVKVQLINNLLEKAQRRATFSRKKTSIDKGKESIDFVYFSDDNEQSNKAPSLASQTMVKPKSKFCINPNPQQPETEDLNMQGLEDGVNRASRSKSTYDQKRPNFLQSRGIALKPINCYTEEQRKISIFSKKNEVGSSMGEVKSPGSGTRLTVRFSRADANQPEESKEMSASSASKLRSEIKFYNYLMLWVSIISETCQKMTDDLKMPENAKFWFAQQKANLEFVSTKIAENEKKDEDFNRSEFQTSFLETIQGKIDVLSKIQLTERVLHRLESRPDPSGLRRNIHPRLVSQFSYSNENEILNLPPDSPSRKAFLTFPNKLKNKSKSEEKFSNSPSYQIFLAKHPQIKAHLLRLKEKKSTPANSVKSSPKTPLSPEKYPNENRIFIEPSELEEKKPSIPAIENRGNNKFKEDIAPFKFCDTPAFGLKSVQEEGKEDFSGDSDEDSSEDSSSEASTVRSLKSKEKDSQNSHRSLVKSGHSIKSQKIEGSQIAIGNKDSDIERNSDIEKNNEDNFEEISLKKGYLSDENEGGTSNIKRRSRSIIGINEFDFIRLISKGAFGRVWLVRRKLTGDVYAMKIINFAEKMGKNQLDSLKNEQEVYGMVTGDYIVKAIFSFIHETFLCIVMEYMIGGDLASLLEEYGLFDEQTSRFYIGEVVLALETLHKSGIIHRDIKPDNLLLDSKGHIKLSDFGLSEFGASQRVNRSSSYNSPYKYNENRRRASHLILDIFQTKLPSGLFQESPYQRRHQGQVGQSGSMHMFRAERTYSSGSSKDVIAISITNINKKQYPFQHSSSLLTSIHRRSQKLLKIIRLQKKQTSNLHRIIGTPDYIPPEILNGTDFNNSGGDFWSLGVMLFEFIVGIPPFSDETVEKIFENIQRLRIPWDEIPIGEGENMMSERAADLIKKLLEPDPQKRLKADEIKSHEFFQGIDWTNLRETEAPIIPKWKNVCDTSNFQSKKKYEEKEFCEPFFIKDHHTSNRALNYLLNSLIIRKKR